MNWTRELNWFLAVFAALVFVLIALFSWFYFLDGFPAETKNIEIKKGVGLSAIAKKLEQEGLIRRAEIFFFPALLSGSQRKLKHGAYMVSAGEAPYSIYRKLRRGEVLLTKVTFPEGITLLNMAEILEASQIVPRKKFLALVKDSEYSTEKIGTEVLSLEGFLFPETYFFAPGCPAEKVVEAMLKSLREVWSTLDISGGEFGFREIITIASLIEKETSLPQEKPLVSAVIRNRLKKSMRLEFDPTVIYALSEKFDGDIKKKDIKIHSPYNTYIIRGLPPGPIAAPGLDSIRAALNPADVDYLYFVSNGDKSHTFSSNYKDHLSALRRTLKKNKK